MYKTRWGRVIGEFFLRYLNFRPYKFSTLPFFPVIIPIGERIITIDRNGNIDGDYYHLLSWLNSINHDNMDSKEKLLFALLVLAWSEKQMKHAEYLNNIPMKEESKSFVSTYHSNRLSIKSTNQELRSGLLPNNEEKNEQESEIMVGNEKVVIEFSHF